MPQKKKGKVFKGGLMMPAHDVTLDMMNETPGCTHTSCDGVAFKKFLMAAIEFAEHGRTHHGIKGTLLEAVVGSAYTFFSSTSEQLNESLNSLRTMIIKAGYDPDEAEINETVAIQQAEGVLYIGDSRNLARRGPESLETLNIPYNDFADESFDGYGGAPSLPEVIVGMNGMSMAQIIEQILANRAPSSGSEDDDEEEEE